MDTEKIVQDLNRRFAAPLPEFHKRRIIFWYDEELEFADKLDGISLDNARLIKLTGTNSFAVKKLLAADDTEENYLVYCPVVYDRPEDNWLLNIELYSGEIFRADLYTMWMDEMGLVQSQVLRNCVKHYRVFFGDENRRRMFSKFAPGVSTPSQFHLAVMAAVCGLKDVSYNGIIRQVIKNGLDSGNNPVYKSLVKYEACKAFWALAAQATGYKNDEKPDIAVLALHILLTSLTRTVRREYLGGLEKYISIAHQSYCCDFISDWLHSDDAGSLRSTAEYAEDELRLYQRFENLDIDELSDIECLPCINEIILSKLMTEIKNQIIRTDVIVKTVEKRRVMAWYDSVSEYYNGLLRIAAMQSFFVEHSSGFHSAAAKDVWNKYTADYYRMDTYYRQFHVCFQNCLKKSDELLDDLFKAVADKAEALYSGWYLTGLDSNWTSVCGDDMERFGHIEGVDYQEDFYGSNVRKCDSRVFVIISDALRYEVAVTLADQLRRDTQSMVNLSSVCGIFPTITPYGMAALLPHRNLSVEKKSNGNLNILADGLPTDSLNREKVLTKENPDSVVLQYRDIIKLNQSEQKELVRDKQIIYIYHDRIDKASHISDSDVFPACDDAINELKNLVLTITKPKGFDGRRIFITADHGFLYTYDPLAEDDKVSKNGWNGQEVEYGRRYAIMNKGAHPEYLQQVRYLDGNSDYDAFTPKENIRIKMSGSGMNYVHGGISLQEMVVPVIDYHDLRSDTKAYQRNKDRIDSKPVTISLVSTGRKICNMIFSLNFFQKDAVSGNHISANYLVCFTDSAGKTVSDTVKIIADKTSGNTQDRTFRCSFSLKNLQFDSKETYYLVIADESGLQLPVREEFQIDIAFAVDEFNFF